MTRDIKPSWGKRSSGYAKIKAIGLGTMMHLWAQPMVATAAVDVSETMPGVLEVTGVGTASAEPEVVRIALTAYSRCQPSSTAANEANAKLGNQLIAIIEKYKEAEEESTDSDDLRVTTNIGPSYRQDETEGYGESFRTLCRQKWRASLSISAGIKDYSRLAQLQDEILSSIDANTSTMYNESEPQTWAEVAIPYFDVLTSTMTQLKKEAQFQALENARAKVAGFNSVCGFSNLQLTKISEPSFTSSSDRYKGVYAAAAAFEPTETPVRPGLIEVHSRWDFIWTYTPASPEAAQPRCIR